VTHNSRALNEIWGVDTLDDATSWLDFYSLSSWSINNFIGCNIKNFFLVQQCATETTDQGGHCEEERPHTHTHTHRGHTTRAVTFMLRVQSVTVDVHSDALWVRFRHLVDYYFYIVANVQKDPPEESASMPTAGERMKTEGGGQHKAGSSSAHNECEWTEMWTRGASRTLTSLLMSAPASSSIWTMASSPRTQAYMRGVIPCGGEGGLLQCTFTQRKIQIHILVAFCATLL